MRIVIIVLSVIVISTSLFLLLKILRRVFHEKARIVWMVSLLAALLVSIVLNRLFFVKMEFIQSQVYSNLYLIKNPVEDKNNLYGAIKEMVIQKMDGRLKHKNEISIESETFKIRFYEYNNGDWGESGTAYFIENKERRDGMTAELLEYYPEYLLAEFSLQPCKTESSEYYGKLDYYNADKRIKTDTLLNSCK